MVELEALSDREIVARTLDGEAGNQGYSGQQAVGNVIQKRVELKWQGETTARGVCLHRSQFDCWDAGPDRDRITDPDYVTPEQCLLIADMILKQILPDITNGADSYEVTEAQAYWGVNLTPSAVIGDQSFYVTRKVEANLNT